MRTLLTICVGILWAAVAAAQTPLGQEFVPASTSIDATEQFAANAVCDESSVCALVWSSYNSNDRFTAQWGRTISASGALSQIRLLWVDPDVPPIAPVVSTDGGFAIFGSRLNVAANAVRLNLRLVDGALHPLTSTVPLRVSVPDPGLGGVATIPGGFVELVSLDLPGGLALLFFDKSGHELRTPLPVYEGPPGAGTGYYQGEFGLDDKGNVVVALAHPDANGQLQAYVRRFSASGEPLDGEVQVSTDLSLLQYRTAVAVAPDGAFFVAWLSQDPAADFGKIWGRRYGTNGEPLTEPFRVSHDVPAQAAPLAVAEGHGNYFVAWDSHENGTYDLHARIYRPDGAPVTRDDLVINQDQSFDQMLASAAFAPNGTLTVSYGTDDPAVTGGEASLPVVRRFAASPGQEICAKWDSNLQCNLGRTGGTMQLQLNVPSRNGEVTLLGDVDGDGRDDVCFYRDGVFSCDTSHEGTPPMWRERFGFPGDVPLLADVDGDGKADPCVRRGNLLICDTAHDGSEGYRLRFGRGGETPLLGDLDGDGKADLCLVSGSLWTCRLSSTGQTITFTFGKAGDSPALGDVDMDGKADPCVLRKGLLLCNTKHDGGPANYILQLDVPAGARLLFGNLDGL